MNWLLDPMAEPAVNDWEQFLNIWVFILSMVFLAFELIRYFLKNKLSWSLVGDTLANYVTQVFSLGLAFLIYGAFYISAFLYLHQFSVFDIGISWATIAICVILADLVYYWEHRFTHRVAIAWATHTVHHSSPFFNISVAYRFGPMDYLWPVLFHIPLVLLGFNPFVVFFSVVFVQLYQTFLHTEAIGKLPKSIEAIMNTPSHHRVHHGSNNEYIDKNYAGIFIVWDRMFGTYTEEKVTVVYGIAKPIDSVNPFIVFFHGLVRLGRQISKTRGFGNKLALLVKPPGWVPKPDSGPNIHPSTAGGKR